MRAHFSSQLPEVCIIRLFLIRLDFSASEARGVIAVIVPAQLAKGRQHWQVTAAKTCCPL